VFGKEKNERSVYFVGDAYMGKPIAEDIQADSDREAANLFFLNHPKEYDCRIKVGEAVFSASELFPARGFVPLEEELEKLGSKLIFDGLDQHSKDVLFEIYRQFPEWLALAEHEKEWKERFTIEWQAPHPEMPILFVSTGWGAFIDLLIGFSGTPAHIHMIHQSYCFTIEHWVKRVNEFAEMIKSEKLIYYESSGFNGTGDINTPVFVKEVLNKGKLKKAYSWLGTYNYPKEK